MENESRSVSDRARSEGQPAMTEEQAKGNAGTSEQHAVMLYAEEHKGNTKKN